MTTFPRLPPPLPPRPSTSTTRVALQGAPIGANAATTSVAHASDAFVHDAGHPSSLTPFSATEAWTGVALEGAHALALGPRDLVSVRGATIAVNGGASRVTLSWWRVTVPAAGGSRSMAPDVMAHARARALLASGELAGAWRALADSGDGFARLVSSTLTTPSTVYSQVVDAHWERHTGQGVDGARYREAATALLEGYLAFASEHGALPSTEEIESLDRAGLAKLGLPAVLATGACQSKLAHDLDASFSWGRAMGLPPERIAARSTVFADVAFDATNELAKTAVHAVTKYGLNKALTLDGAAATLRGTGKGGSLSISPIVLARAQAFAASGEIARAWRELARHGDDYAESAAKIVSERDAPRDFLAAVVDAHWLRVVGADKKAAHFDAVAKRHIDNYLALVAGNGGKLPSTREIERSYRSAVEAEGLPALVAIDALLSRADCALPGSWLAKIGITELSWGAVCGMPKERIAYQSDVFADLDLDPATELALTTTATLRRHFFTLLRPSNASYPFHAVRELFS